MRARTFLAAGLAAAAALAASGCGGSAAAPGAAGAGASLVPADAVAFAAVDTDADSSQRQALDGLLAKLPGSDALLGKLAQALGGGGSGLSWKEDVEPAVGPELDVAVLPSAGGAEPAVVLLTRPRDSGKLDALLAKLGGHRPSTRTVDGWTAVSDSAGALDAVAGAGARLGDSSVYQEATGRLAGNALVRVYANGAEARRLAGGLGGLGGALPGSTARLVWAAADVVASDAGLKLDGYLRSEGGTPQQAFSPQLLDRIPSDALAVVDFTAGRRLDAPASGTTNPLLDAFGKVARALGGETALYVGRGVPFPAVTLVTRPSDPQTVLDALRSALGSLGAGGRQGGAPGLGALLGGLRLSHATVGEDLVVSTSQQAVDAFRGSGAKLAHDAGFRAAAAAAGMPAETAGFLYVDVKDALPMLGGLAALAGGSLPTGDLGALRSLTAYLRGDDGGVTGFTIFLAIR